jgi:hypothetical protein
MLLNPKVYLRPRERYVPAHRRASPRPLGDLNTAMRDLNMDANEVRVLLDVGKLVGFNVAVRQGGKAILRVLMRSVEHYLETGAALPLTWQEIVRVIIPSRKPFVRGVEMRQALNCDKGHIQNLILANRLVCIKKAGPGPNGSPLVTRDSFEAFIKARML